MNIELKPAYENKEEIKALFSEYTQMLVDNDSEFAEYLAVQNYEGELNHLTDKYGMPEGRLYIAWADDKPAGCIGLLRLDADRCEMKRLYVRPEFRGNRIADRLVEQIISDAKSAGYREMYLDTLPFLKGAVHLYKKYGFFEVLSYNNSPMDTSIYMKINL